MRQLRIHLGGVWGESKITDDTEETTKSSSPRKKNANIDQVSPRKKKVRFESQPKSPTCDKTKPECVSNQMKSPGSDKLQVLHFTGIMLSLESCKALSEGTMRSTSLKRLVINNSTLGLGKNLDTLTTGLCMSQSVETIDFQLNNLSDKHSKAIVRLVKEQFELREQMKWRLGLRSMH